jgi:anti-sigma regulatory factor (Ser/Thr protein kinase)
VEWALEPADTAAVHRLRHQIMQTLARIATPEADLSAAAIVVAELLTNALAHASGRAWVSLRWDGTHPLLSVADQGPGFGPNSGLTGLGTIDGSRTLVPRLPDDPLAESGRGLFLMAQLALDVAVAARTTGGTVVSVTLDLKRAS